jgi:hypothetical protein
MSAASAGTYPARMDHVDAEPRAAINHAWYSWQQRTYADVTLREAFEVGFRRGAQWSTRMTSQLSPHIATLTDFLVWLMQNPIEQSDWDTFEEPVPVPLTSNGSGDESNPW